ncbi:Tripartite motif-containing protein 45 [Operophtera brumata]|uniref:Tripartite motif-containing protein 45 n=1 Tax=Operophtera brumata TaxID=104452 RepID=A0A0L7LI21_OPEBR|nr:Tripartite motif-containing protein 45 [Operophtera brumata]
MEVDRIRYIFGSFTRKKDKRKSLEQSSISAGNSPLHGKTRPISNLNIAPRTSAYDVKERRKSVKEWDCRLCGKGLAEPRVLACLHSFCTRCLQDLPQDGAEGWAEDGGSGAGSAGSGYESDLRHSGSDGSWDPKPRKYGIFTRKISGMNSSYILCPACGYETPLPLGGISALPLNYVLLRKMAASQDESGVNAESRCDQCLVSICSSCGENHGRQKATSRHSLLPIDPSPPSYCSQHPRSELSVVCRDCCVISHSGHAACSASRAAAERVRRLRDAAQRAQHVPEHSQAARVEVEIQTWADQYRRAVEAHGRALYTSATRARQKHRQRVEETHRQLEERSRHAKEAVEFAEELLAQGKEAELLSLSGPVLRRLELLTETPAGDAPKMELRFAPKAPASQDSTLVGRLLTQAPDPATWFQDLRVNRQHEVVMELRDSSGERIWCGGEQVNKIQNFKINLDYINIAYKLLLTLQYRYNIQIYKIYQKRYLIPNNKK